MSHRKGLCEQILLQPFEEKRRSWMEDVLQICSTAETVAGQCAPQGIVLFSKHFISISRDVQQSVLPVWIKYLSR